MAAEYEVSQRAHQRLDFTEENARCNTGRLSDSRVTDDFDRSTGMSPTPLHTYLNDHLAGSVMALELLDHLAGAATTSDARQFFTTLRQEIAADQETLQALLRRLGGAESPVRQAGAWLAEKFGRVKLRVDEAVGGRLRPLEGLEMLALGIQGKLALWVALDTVSDRIAELRTIDLPHLQQRARDQHAQVEARRLTAARECLGDSSA
jgi:hypothetical protein